MKNAILGLTTAVLALSGLSSAHADTFTPPSSTSVFTGTVGFSSGSLTLSCTMTVTIIANGGGTDAWVSAATLGSGLCSLFPPTNFTWNIDVTAPLPPPTGVTATQIKVANVQAGPCGPGDLLANWNSSGPSITFPIGTMLSSCRIQGTLTQSSGPSLAITN